MRYVSMKTLTLPTISLTFSRQLLILPSSSSLRGGLSSGSFSLPARSPRIVYWTSPSPTGGGTTSHSSPTFFSFDFTQPMVTRATLTPKGLTLARSTPLPVSRYTHPSSSGSVGGPSYFPTLSERRYLSIAFARPLRPSAMGFPPSSCLVSGSSFFLHSARYAFDGLAQVGLRDISWLKCSRWRPCAKAIVIVVLQEAATAST
mmetsp:Transcript_20700/g.67541  ORF Transcript_20700/g.67541 Transcript_20700/m.67541 type:complete len:203 (+) Transcript_20700:324-932(+)